MSFAKSQKGTSVLGVMVILCLVAFFLSAGLKVGPHYMDFYTIQKLIKAVEEDKSGDITSVQDFYARISKGMTINGIRNFDLEKNLQVKLENDEFLAHLKYEQRESLIGNLDLVARFDKELRVHVP